MQVLYDNQNQFNTVVSLQGKLQSIFIKTLQENKTGKKKKTTYKKTRQATFKDHQVIIIKIFKMKIYSGEKKIHDTTIR